MSRPRSRTFWVLAYFLLAAMDFLYFLYSHHLSHAIGACVFVFVAISWDWWFRRLAKENELTKLGLNATPGRTQAQTRQLG